MAKNIVVDLGNCNINYNGDYLGSFSAKKEIGFKKMASNYERITIGNATTFIGVGIYDKESTKANKDYIAQLLYAIVKATGNEDDIIDVNLGLLLPIAQMEMKDQILSKIKDKTIEFKFNDKDKIVNFKNTYVFPEGFASIACLSDEEKTGSVLLLDCGSRTINYFIARNAALRDSDTIPFGTFAYYNDVLNREVENGRTNLIIDEIEEMIEDGLITNTEIILDKFYGDVINAIKGIASFNKFNRVVFTGGGALLLEEKIIENLSDIAVICPDPANSNVNGAKKILDKLCND